MKFLIVGNSQAGALKLALDKHPEILEGHTPHFFVVPGGSGPYLRIADDKLVVNTFNEDFPPRIHPSETSDLPLASYDAIVVSALGYVDGGFKWKNVITATGVVEEFGPKIADELISDTCFEAIVAEGLERQPGVMFLRELAAAYQGPIYLQPFPRPSELLTNEPEWGLKLRYHNVQGAHQRLMAAKDAALAALCADLGITLLDYPKPDAWPWSPSDWIRDIDLIHANEIYGAEVLRQIAYHITAEQGQ